MNYLFRVDSSNHIGSGHLMRCLTLAETLREGDGVVFFICRDLPGNLINLIKKKKFDVIRLPAPVEQIEVLDWNYHASWLGVPWLQDADEATNAIKNIVHKFDWLIVDHYALDKQWEKLFRQIVKNIMVIDDLADRVHDCDILLDQNFYEDIELRYKNLIHDKCRLLLGPKFALLRDEFSRKDKNIKIRKGKIKNILIFYGGVDQTNETLKAIKAINILDDDNISVDVVVGVNNPHKMEISRKCSQSAKFHFFCQVENIAKLMLKADLAIGAGGSFSWERCALGLPAVITSIADNQKLNCKNLAKLGAAIYLGEKETVTSEDIANALLNLSDQDQLLATLSINAKNLVDTLGTYRVVSEITGTEQINSFPAK